MYKIIIVDDEDLIRDGLRKYIDWNKMGFSISGEASDGAKAYELIASLQPDVVMTDIKMPFCSGIELMEKITGQFPRTRIVVLSGYNEFEYARASIEAGAVAYLLKPIKFDKLHETFLKIKTDLDSKVLEEQKRFRANELIKNRLMSKLINGNIEKAELLNMETAEAGIPSRFPQYRLFLMKVMDYEAAVERYGNDDLETLSFALANLAKELFEPLGAVCSFPYYEKTIGLLLGYPSADAEFVESLASEFLMNARRLLKIRLAVTMSDAFFPLTEAVIAKVQCLELLDHAFFIGTSRLITSDVATAHVHSQTIPPKVIQPERIALLLQGKEREALERYIDECLLGARTKERAIEIFNQLLSIFVKYMEHIGIPTGKTADGNPFLPENSVSTNSLGDMRGELGRFVGCIFDMQNVSVKKGHSRLVKEVVEYIDRHFAEDISLESAADHIYMHPMHVSKMFKRATGQNFTDYLTEVRIARAKQFLTDIGLKIYEISGKVGYNDPKHFSKVFKNKVGVTPKEYQLNILGFADDAATS